MGFYYENTATAISAVSSTLFKIQALFNPWKYHIPEFPPWGSIKHYLILKFKHFQGIPAPERTWKQSFFLLQLVNPLNLQYVKIPQHYTCKNRQRTSLGAHTLDHLTPTPLQSNSFKPTCSYSSRHSAGTRGKHTATGNSSHVRLEKLWNISTCRCLHSETHSVWRSSAAPFFLSPPSL